MSTTFITRGLITTVDPMAPHSIDLNWPARVAFYVLYFLIFAIGLFGNSLVCYVVYRQPTMRTVTNAFIVNLALADILLCLFAVPFTPLYLLLFKEWVFGSTLCHLVPFAQGVSVYISTFTLMCIAIERYSVIVHPFRRSISLSKAVGVIVLIWILSALLTAPYGLFIGVLAVVFLNNAQTKLSTTIENGIVRHNKIENLINGTQAINSNELLDAQTNEQISDESLETWFRETLKPHMYCDEMWPNEQLRVAFGLSTTAVQFVLPFAIIMFCYVRICSKLWDRVRTRPGSGNFSSQRKWLERERAKKTNMMLISMVIIFALSWLPLNCYNLFEDFSGSVSLWIHSKTLFVLFHLAAMSSTCYNTFLYAWLNDNFRREFVNCAVPALNRCFAILHIKRQLVFATGQHHRAGSIVGNGNASGGVGGVGSGGVRGFSFAIPAKIHYVRPQALCVPNNLEMLNGSDLLGASSIGIGGSGTTVQTELRTTPNASRMGFNGHHDSNGAESSTNMVTYVESVNEIELQESLLATASIARQHPLSHHYPNKQRHTEGHEHSLEEDRQQLCSYHTGNSSIIRHDNANELQSPSSVTSATTATTKF